MTYPDIVGVIPAYNPDETLLRLVEELRGYFPLVVVNDGSDSGLQFERLIATEGVTLLTHHSNRGKGAALKTAFRHVLDQYSNSIGVLTLDADGQHLPPDVVRIAQRLCEQPKSLALGVRSFTDGIPLRSRLGNLLTRWVMRVFTRVRISDTQTGLRGIPTSALPALLKIPFNRYEFETEMLVAMKESDFAFEEVPIQTVYLNANRGSHFRPILDSLRVYWVLLRHMLAGVTSVAVDYAVYLVALTFSGHILSSVYAGRVSSLLINFLLVKHFAFRSRSSGARQFVLYLIQVFGMAFVTAQVVSMAASLLDIAPAYSKIPVDTLMYPINFTIQRVLIFRDASAGESSGHRCGSSTRPHDEE